MDNLIYNTASFKQFLKDKNNNKLSHSYLLLCADAAMHREYLKIYAKAALCDDILSCGGCRHCNLVEEERHTDVFLYPRNKEKLSVATSNEIVLESVVKPLEADKKIFLISNADELNANAQNKLLKTLEEPPDNVIIILAVENRHKMLPTVVSRLKKIDVPSVNYDFENESMSAISEFCFDMLENMQSSAQIPQYFNKINAFKDEMSGLLLLLKVIIRDTLTFLTDGAEYVFRKNKLREIEKISKSFTAGSAIACIEKINEAEKKLNYNVNAVMITDGLLLTILEEKYRWRKLRA